MEGVKLIIRLLSSSLHRIPWSHLSQGGPMGYSLSYQDALTLERVGETLKNNRELSYRIRLVLAVYRSQQTGESINNIALRYSCAPGTIRKYVRRYLDDGLEGLRTVPSPGRPSFLSDSDLNRLEDLFSFPPSAYGYATEEWSIHLVYRHVIREGLFEAGVSPETIKSYLRKLDLEVDLK